MMVARDDEAYKSESESDGVISNGITQVQLKEKHVFANAEDEIPEYQKELLAAKDNMADVADMYQQDYLDKVEQRADLANEAKVKAVSCLVDVSEKIYNLAGCFQQLLEDQVDKLQEIENMTVSVSASLEITSCYNFRNELHSRIPAANIASRQPRIGRPDSLQPEDFFKENVAWEKLNYKKYDKIGAGFDEDLETEMDSENTSNIPLSTSQHSLQSVGSSTKSYVTASSLTSPSAPTPAAPPSNTSHLSAGSDKRLSVSSVDIRPQGSPAMIRYGSSNSLTSLNSSQSLKILPARAAPAPPPAKMNPNRQRVYSVKNQTGEGLEKPNIPAPRPPIPEEEEDHYAVPPSSNHFKKTPKTATPDEVIYDDVRSKTVPVNIPEEPRSPAPQYQTILVTPEDPPPPPGKFNDEEFYSDVDNIYDAPSLPRADNPTVIGRLSQQPRPPGGVVESDGHVQDDDELYAENELLPPPDDMTLDEELPPPPPDILPPPPPSPPVQEEEEEMYSDMMGIPAEDDDIYTDNVIDHNDIAKAHTVSVSKDSGFYTEDQDDEDPVLESVRAIFPYAATASDELNLAVGDLIAVHVKNPDGWYEGTHNGIRGLFPGNYVEPVE